MDSPLLVEQHFQTLRQALLLMTGQRRKLFRILEFAEPLIHSSSHSYLPAYAHELLPELCQSVRETDFAGTHPEFLKHCERLIRLLLVESEDEAFVLDAESALHHLQSEYDRILSWMQLRSLKQSELGSATSPGRRVRPGATAWIPVVEQEPLLAETFRQFAGLRQLHVEVQFSSSNEDMLDIRGLAGHDNGGPPVSSLEAARALASRVGRIDVKRPVLVRSRFMPVHNGQPDSINAESFGAGLGVLLFAELLRLHGHGEEFQVRDDVAITGRIDPQGKLLPVDPHFMRAKVEACTFSWIRYLAVPAEQEQLCTDFAANIVQESSPSDDFPSAAVPLQIVAVKTLEDVVLDSRLTQSRPAQFADHAARKGWKKKRLFTVALTLGLLAIVWKVWNGPIDSDPVRFAYQGGILQIQNEQQQVIDRIPVGNRVMQPTELAGKKRSAAFFDIDQNGTNEIFWVQQPSPGTSSGSIICCKALEETSPLWSFSLKELPGIPGDDIPGSADFVCDQLIVDDIDADNVPEVVLAARHALFPSVVLILNGASGREKGRYVHTGRITDLEVVDLDEDGMKEIVVVGTNTTYRNAFVAVLDQRLMGGYSPTTKQHLISGHNPAAERIYLRVPPTVVSQVYNTQTEGNSCITLRIDARNKLLRLLIRDLTFAAENTGDRLTAHLKAYFDYTLRPVIFSAGDDFGALYASLLHDGRIPDKPRRVYLREYKNEVLYWNGTEWQPEVVMNKRYLEAVARQRLALFE